MLFSYAVIIPMANEENDFESFVSILKDELDRIGSGSVYFIVDKVLFYYFFKWISVFVPKNSIKLFNNNNLDAWIGVRNKFL